MIVIFKPSPPTVDWCAFEGDAAVARGSIAPAGSWLERLLSELPPGQRIEAVGYVCENGANVLKDPVTILTRKTLGKLRHTLPWSPEANALTFETCSHWFKHGPETTHALLCDTAFFSRLPGPARNYAIPQSLAREGVRRYGLHGLVHEWGWERVCELTGRAARRVVSVVLGPRPDLAAIAEGVPRDTTAGFTAVEGLMSEGACGDIDPTIVFQLKMAGHSYRDINRMLTRQSGFTALAGGNRNVEEVLGTPVTPGDTTARQVFSYQLTKAVGAFTAVLGGLDSLLFLTHHRELSSPFVVQFCGSLGFLGLECSRTPAPCPDGVELTRPGSPVRAFVLDCDPWRVLAGRVYRALGPDCRPDARRHQEAAAHAA